MKNTKVKALADGAVCTAVTVLLLVIAVYVPPLALFSIAVAGTPLIFLGVRHGLGTSGTACAASILVLFVLTGDPVSALLMGIVDLLPGLVIGYAISKRASFQITVFAAAGAVLFGIMLQLILLNASGGGDGIEKLVDGTLENTKQILNSVMGKLASAGTQGKDLTAVLNTMIDQMREMIFLYLPSFVVGASVVLGYAVCMMGIYVLRRLRICHVLYTPFNRLHASRSMCYVTMIMFLVASFSKDSTIYTAALKNMIGLLYAFIGVCGFSLIDYKFSEKLPSGYARAAIYAAAILAGYVMIGLITQVLILLGLVDGMFNFRRLSKAGEDHVKHE